MSEKQQSAPPRIVQARSIDRAYTIYEQMVGKGTDFSMEDETHYYITAPASEEAMLARLFRIGYEPDGSHPLNDANNVVLKIRKETRRELYEEACRRVVAAVQDGPSSDQGMSQSTAKYGKPAPIEELVKALPDDDES